MRAALGASRVRIVGQLLAENVTLALISGAFGVALAFWLDRLLPRVFELGPGTPADGGLSWQALLCALALSILTGVLCGAGPALRASSQLLAEGLARGSRTTGEKPGASFRGVLVVGQVAVSLVLLAGAGLLIRSFVRLAGTNPGFEVQNLLTGEVQTADVQNDDYQRPIRFFEALREDLAGIPGVEAVGFISSLPIRNPSFNLTVWETGNRPSNPDDVGMAHRRVVLPGYFDAIRIGLRAGRDFGPGDRYGKPLSMIINERMARTLFRDRNPIGQRVSVDMFGKFPEFEVVGVVGDARLDFVGDSPPMTMYLSYYQFPDATMRFAIRTSQEPELVTQTVRRLVLTRDRTVAVENLVSMERIVGESLAPRRATAILLALLATLALLLAAIGLYGVLAYSVSQRTREIGLRLALGARPGDVLRLMMGHGIMLASAGLALGLAGAAGLTRLLESLLYEVRPTDPLTFCAVSSGLLGVALVATYFPARRAANVDPMLALRLD